MIREQQTMADASVTLRGRDGPSGEAVRVLPRLTVPLVIVAALLLISAGPGGAARSTRRAPTRIERAMVQDLLVDINTMRAKHGRRAVSVASGLARAADQHVREMGRYGYFSHDSLDGTDFWTRIEHYYPSGGFRYWVAGENLLWSGRNITPQEALGVWLRSPRHRANLLRRGWRQIGISAHRFPSAPGFFHHWRVWIIAAEFGARY